MTKSCLFHTLLGCLTFYCGQNEESNEGVVDGTGRLGNARQDRIGIQEVAGKTHIFVISKPGQWTRESWSPQP